MKDSFYWKSDQIKEVLRLALTGDVLNKDIAAKFDRKPAAITFLLKKHGVKNQAARKIVGKSNSKHSHLREKVMRYFLNHTKDETCKKFGLLDREIKSLFTIGYRLPEFKHLRKDKRNHKSWTVDEYKFLLQHCGLKSRDWIAKKLKRGGELGIKDRLDILNISSKSINGLTISQYRVLFGKNPEFYLQSSAGPHRKLKSRKNSASYYKIIPWVYLNEQIKLKRLKTVDPMIKLINSMALFQNWVFEGNALVKMKKIVRSK